MALTDTLQKNITGWGTIAIVIVVMAIVLLKFKDVSGVTSGLNTTIDTFITGISEPQNWVIIFIIALIGFAVLKLFLNKK